MALSGQKNINIGAENSPTGSDSLYDAFNKVQDNFEILFANSSPYVNFQGSVGITTIQTTDRVQFINTGVTSITAGSGIAVSSSNGNVTISVTQLDGNVNTGVTRVGAQSNTLSVLSTPVISTGNIILELPETGVVSGQYVRPTLTVDAYGRIVDIQTGPEQSGTVTSVEIEGGDGIEVTNSIITSNGTIKIKNTGVTRLNAGAGIEVNADNGEVTVGLTESLLSKISESSVTDLGGQYGDVLFNNGNGVLSWQSPSLNPILFGDTVPITGQYSIGTLFYVFSGVTSGLYIFNGTNFSAISTSGNLILSPPPPLPSGFVNPVVEDFLLETISGETVILSLGAPLEVSDIAELSVAAGSVIEIFD